MATAEEGGATANTTSSYGGGGAGGKFRKKPPRRQTTPYDRPPTTLRGNNINNNSNSSWLTKLVVEPASKLITYGADRFFASVFRRRLPPPPPPQPPEVNADVSDEDQVAGVDDGQDRAQEPGGGESSQPINSSSSNVVLELEQLLKQKTFTRSEVVHLTELLQSRAVETSHENASQKNEETSSDFGRRQEYASGLLEGNRNEGIRSSAVVSTPVHNSRVLEDDIASAAEVAKVYMGSRPPKVSPSELGTRSQLGRDGAGLLTTMPFASKSPIMSMTKKTPVNWGAPENGFITPRSRSRSAIYNMARTPYSRVHPSSILKGSGINSNGYAGPSTSSPLPLVENNEKFESQTVTLKRRSSVLDDEGGSVGPIRRIRQKSNLVPRFRHNALGTGIGSHSKQEPALSDERRDKALSNVVENKNGSLPSTSYPLVHTRSTEFASRILQRLDELSPKGKSSESKLVAGQKKSPLKSSPIMPEDVGTSKSLLDAHGDQKFGNRANVLLPDAHDSSPQKQGKAEESEPKKTVVPSVTWNSVLNNDSAISLKASMAGSRSSVSVVNDGASQPPQKKRAFRMSAQEDSEEQDDVRCNGFASRSLSENKGPMVSLLPGSNLPSAEAYKVVKPTIESKDKPPSGLFSSRINAAGLDAIRTGEGINVSHVPALEEPKTTPSEAFASSLAASGKPMEANNPPMFSFSSNVADKFPSLPAESSRREEPEVGRSSSSDNVSVSIGSEVKAPESDKGSHANLAKPGEINGKCDDTSSASNGPIFSSSSPVSFPTVPCTDANQISTGSAPPLTSSTNITSFAPTGTSTSSTSSGSIFGLGMKPSDSAGPLFKFGSSENPFTAVSPASTTKVEINPSTGSSSSSARSASSIFGLGSFTNSTGTNLQGSLFAGASKPLASDAGTVSQGTSTSLFSSASAPAFNVSTSSSSPTFGFSSSASSSGPTSVDPVDGPAASPFKFGASPPAASSSAIASPGIFGFGSSSSSSTMAVVPSSGPNPSTFNFGGTTSSPASLNNTGSSFNSDTSGIFNFGGSSSASSSSSSALSTAFGSSLQSQISPIFGSQFTPTSPSTGFAFGGGPSSSPGFSFTTSSALAMSSPSLPSTQPVFGNPPIGGGFAASPVNNDQMNAEDSMAEDPVPPSAPGSVFGQPPVSSSHPGFGFGSSTVPSQVNPFIFGGQQNQVAPQNPSPFQASGSLEFNAGGGFSLGSGGGGGDKSGRKIVKISRNKNRRK